MTMPKRNKRMLVGLVALAVVGGLLLVVSAPNAKGGVLVEMYKSPTCGCCGGWLAAMDEAGYATSSKAVDDMAAIKQGAGVPEDMQSCHTAFVEGYWIEGHVAPAAVQKLLSERPDVAGLAVPGMPQGAPGMSGQKEGPIVVYAVFADGSFEPYFTF